MNKHLSNLKIRFTQLPAEFKFILFVLFVCLVLFSKYIFGDSVYIFTDIGSDTINAYYPKYYFLSSLLHGNFSWYSFSLGLGESTFSGLLFDPFISLLYLLPLESISSGIVFTIILKILFVCFFSWKFFNLLISNQNPIFYAASSLAIGFSGLFILWGQHYAFSSALAFIPFLLYSFERFLQKGKWLLFVIATALSSISFFFLYQISIFAAVYFITRILLTDKQTNETKVIFVLKTFGLYILGLLMFSFLLFPTLESMIESPRIGINGGSILDQLTFNSQEIISYMILRIFSNNAFGDALSYNGILNYYETPQLFTLFLLLLFVPQAFYIKEKALKVLSVVLGIFALAFILTPATSYIFNGFQYVSYRWGFIFSSLISIIGFIGIYAYISDPNKTKKNILVGTACATLIAIFFASLAIPHFTPTMLVLKVVFFSTAYIYVFSKYLSKARVFSILIISLLFVEILVEHTPTVANRITLQKDFEESKSLYFNQNKDAFEKIQCEDSSFYRIVNNNSSCFLNDAYVQGYNGITSYHALNNPYYLRFLAKTNVPLLFPGNYSYIINFNDRPLLYDLLGVKYHLSTSKLLNQDYTLIHSNGVFSYNRNTSLPFGFTYDSYMLESQFSNCPDDISFLTTAILSEEPQLRIDKLDKLVECVDLKDLTAQTISGSSLQLKSENVEMKDGSYISKNNDPMIIISNLRDLDFNICNVEFDLDVNKPTSSQIFWNNDISYFTPEQSVTFASATGLNKHNVQIKSNTPIKELRIDPTPEQSNFKIENIKLTYYTKPKYKVDILDTAITSLNVSDFKGSLSHQSEYSSTSIDPQFCVNIPQILLDTCTLSITMIVRTEYDSDCQVFWKNNSFFFDERRSVIRNISKNKFDTLRFEITDNIAINQLRIDLGRNAGKCSIQNLSVSTVKKMNSSKLLRAKLLEDTLTITHFEGDLIKGNIKTAKNKLLFLPISYSHDWHITVNGESVEPLLTNYGFMSIPLEKGDHSIVLSYFSNSMLWGIITSITSILVVIFLKYKLFSNLIKRVFHL